MSHNDPLLTVYLDRIPAEGTELSGEVAPDDLGLDGNSRVVFSSPVKFTLHLSLVKEKLLARGRISTDYQAQCDRCLETYRRTIELNDVCQYFDETDNDEIDLTDTLREDILIDFPQRLVCTDSCRGLCAVCGRNLNDGLCECRQEPAKEDFWSVLDGLSTGGD